MIGINGMLDLKWEKLRVFVFDLPNVVGLASIWRMSMFFLLYAMAATK